jgi:FSR family fosmidomycin resistance protein-like MFS transporter
MALGPTLAGVMLQNFGLAAMPYMALVMAPAAVYMLWQLRRPYEEVVSSEPTPPAAIKNAATPTVAAAASNASKGTGNPIANNALYIALAFVLLITFRSTTQQGFTTLLPRFFSDQGITPAVYGVMLSVLGFAGATGTFVGGWLGDRFNRRMIIFVSMTIAAFFSFAMLHTTGWLYIVAALVAGITMNIPHSILIIMAQRLIPARKGMMGGAVLGLMFASGAATTGLGSWVADYVGLPAVLSVFALLPIGAGLCALTLPSTRGSAPAAAAKPAQETAASTAGD